MSSASYIGLRFAGTKWDEIKFDEYTCMNMPRCPQKAPYIVMVKEGVDYAWCSCGLSAKQPWCDGAHGDTGFKPIKFVAPISGEFYMCGCKQSENAPYCFGNCMGHAPSQRTG